MSDWAFGFGFGRIDDGWSLTDEGGNSIETELAMIASIESILAMLFEWEKWKSDEKIKQRGIVGYGMVFLGGGDVCFDRLHDRAFQR